MTSVNVIVEIPEWLSKELPNLDIQNALSELHTEQPILKAGKYVLHGRLQETVGTDIVFQPTLETKLKGIALKRIVFEETKDRVLKRMVKEKKKRLEEEKEKDTV